MSTDVAVHAQLESLQIEELGSANMHEHAPHSGERILAGIMMLLGVGTLLPFNVFATERTFYEVRAQQQPTWHAAADNFENLMVLVFQLCNYGGMMALLPLASRLSLNALVLWPLLANVAAMAAAIALAAAPSTSGAAVIGITLPTIGLTGATSACLQAGTFALASHFAPHHIQAILAGQAIAGLGVAMASFATTWASPPTAGALTPQHVSRPAQAYFLVSLLATAAAAAAYCAMWALPYVRARCKPDGSTVARRADSASEAPMQQPVSEAAPLLNSLTSRSTRGAAQPGDLAVNGDMEAAPSSKQWTMREVAWQLRHYSAAVALDFLVTLAVFPGVASAICPSQNDASTPPCTPHPHAGRLYGELFVPLVFVLFNLGDLVGRAAAGAGRWAEQPPPAAALLAYAGIRAAPAAALLLCNVVTPHAWLPPVLLRSNAWPTALVLLLGLTNGHLASVVCMHGPRLLPPSARERAGTVLALAITSGVTAGSILALVLNVALQQ